MIRSHRRRPRHRARGRGTRRVLRARLRRHGGGEQELDQDPDRGRRPLRAGLLRLRFQEGRRRHRVAPPLRSASHPRALPRAPGRLRRLPPVRLPRAPRRARRRRPRRHRPAECALRSGGRLGPPAARGAGGAAREAAPAVRDRRLRARPRARPRGPHQRHHAGRVLRARRRAAARDGRRAHQGGHREDLRSQGRRRRRTQLRRGGCHAGRAPRGAAAGAGERDPRPPTGRAGRGAGVRATGQRGAARGPRRSAPRERVSRRRHLAGRHRPLGEAHPRARDSGVGCRPLHPVQQVRAHVPARRHPGQGLPARGARGGAAHVQGHAIPGRRVSRPRLHDPGGAGRLHGLRAVRRGLSCQGPREPAAQVHRHGPAAADRRARARELRLLPGAARAGPDAWRTAT